MTNKAANAVVGKPAVAGGIFVAPLGTAIPTDETTALGAGFESVGYLTDAGFTRSRKPNTDKKKAWGGDPLVIINTGTDRTAKFGFAEYLNKKVQELVYGDAQVEETAATEGAGRKLAIVDKEIALPHKVWVIQMFSGPAVGRLIFPDAQISDFDDITYKDDDIAAFPVTLTQFADSTGAFSYEYWTDGVPLPAAG
nr:hypothetical protein [Microbacterium bovistercoris]